MLTELREATVNGTGFLRARTERVLSHRYQFTAFDRGEWVIAAGAWPKQRPRIPPGGFDYIARGGAIPELAVHFDAAPRIAQVVTTLHKGGAEKIALTLARSSLVIALDRPRRATWPEPPTFFQCSRRDRLHEAVEAALAWGADLVHAHLLEREEIDYFARVFPVVTTLHNAACAWPRDILLANAALFIACAKHLAPREARTIWNGIVRAEPIASAQRQNRRESLRILTVANARPQKRMDKWPALLDANPHAHAYIVGEHHVQLHERMHLMGSQDPAAIDADVFVSLSDYEGLSLAELEAIQRGLPVVLSDNPAHRELASLHPHVKLLPAALDAAQPGPLAEDVTAETMRRRHAEHYRQLLRRKPARHDLVLVTNNFSMGGAQTSARHLLHALHARGLKVAAATLQERDLPSLDVECFLGSQDIEPLLDWLAADRVVFWNVIPEVKIRLAELWREGPVYDVSPGEMYFHSLHRYFQRPRVGHPIRTPAEYGALLAGVVVKYRGEADRAERTLQTRTHVIRNGVQIPRDYQRPRAGFTVGTLARLSPDKKLEQLLLAFKQLKRSVPRAELIIGGEHETGSEQYAQALKAAHPDVRWLGRVAANHTFFNQVHAFALIAEPEGCPNASLEAMAHGVPIVGTNAGGASEQIVDGENGFLVPRGDSLALADRLTALSADPDLQARFSHAARRKAQAEFSLESMASRYWEIFSQSRPAAAATTQSYR